MASTIQLTVALGDYDINRPLIDGAVSPQGITAVPLVYPSPERHWRMLLHHEFEACEMSMGSYVALRAREDDSLVAIPVFPHRRFRHSYVFVSGKREVGSAEELRGERVGVRSWQTTAGVWVRGILADRHGLPVDSVRWVAQDADDVGLDLPEGLSLERVPDGETVTDLCARGELAGLVYPEIPQQVHEGSGMILRLFADPRAEEQAYFRETGIFPIMHVVVVRADVLDAHPWVARNLLDAFEESKAMAQRRLKDPRTVSLAWLRWLIEHERELLGPDPWQYGIGPNRHVLETFLRYAHEQGLAARRLEVDELFFDTVREDPPTYV